MLLFELSGGRCPIEECSRVRHPDAWPGRVYRVQVRNVGRAAWTNTCGDPAETKDLVDAGKAGFGALSRLAGRPEELAVRAAATKMQDLEDQQARVNAETTGLEEEARRLRQLAQNEPLGALLNNLASITEYRDQLSLVARTRERFDRIDSAVRQGRATTSPQEDVQLERVVIIIDDLDRCPPENVVKVLEAVHLLFDFEMFVVVLAVDTRWLDQSLRIRYRQLLGETNTAAPTDYLEKIIQVPVLLPPLDEGLVRTMISGLTGQALPDTTAPVPDRHADTAPQPEQTTDESQVVASTAERKRPTRAPLPASPEDRPKGGYRALRGRFPGRDDTPHR